MEIFTVGCYFKTLFYEGRGKYRFSAQEKWEGKLRFFFYNEKNLRDTNGSGKVEDPGEGEMGT